MMKKVHFIIYFICLFSFVAFAQTPNKTGSTKPKKVTYKKAENGVYFKFHTHDEKLTKPVVGDKLRVKLSYSSSKDSVLFDTNDPKVNQGKKYIDFELGPASFKASFEDALMMLSVGDSASFQISADSVFTKTFFMKEVPSYIEKGSMLTFNVKLLEIIKAEHLNLVKDLNEELNKLSIELAKLKEQKSIDDYVRDNNIKVKPNENGVYFINLVKGKTAKVQKGDTITVNYVGRTLSGKTFDTNIETVAKKDSIYNEKGSYKPIDLPFGVGSTIPGWEQGIEQMTVGSKAKFIVPSSQAYGENGLGGPIGPYTAILFEVELLGIKPQKKEIK